MNFQMIARILVRILSISALAMGVCIGVAAYYGEDMLPFAFSAATAATLAVMLYVFSPKQKMNFAKRKVFFAVALSWISISIIGTLPYLFSGVLPYFNDAFFESASGFSTTGASVFQDVEILPKSILFWRSLSNWIGGIGIILLVIVIMPSLKMGSYQMFSMEMQERIVPRITDLGVRLMAIYVVLTALEILLLTLGDMPVFDSVCHALSTISSGGFSTRNAGIAEYSPYIQYVIMLFMMLSGVNFIIFYFIVKGKFNKIKNNEELKYYLLIILITGLSVAGLLFFRQQENVETSLRESFFQIISNITGTGFSTIDSMQWGKTGILFVVLISLCGGCMGSTSGSIKMGRHIVLIKNIRYVIHSQIHPNSVHKITLNKKIISPEDNNTIIGFVSLYFLSILAGSAAMLLFGSDVHTAITTVVSSLGCVGTGNFTVLPDSAKTLLSSLMILGRLELYAILILFFPSYWKKM